MLLGRFIILKSSWMGLKTPQNSNWSWQTWKRVLFPNRVLTKQTINMMNSLSFKKRSFKLAFTAQAALFFTSIFCVFRKHQMTVLLCMNGKEREKFELLNPAVMLNICSQTLLIFIVKNTGEQTLTTQAKWNRKQKKNRHTNNKLMQETWHRKEKLTRSDILNSKLYTQ